MVLEKLNLVPRPNRIVSLVPSLTESFFELGMGNLLVAITDFCVYPEAGVKDLPRIGGTKNPQIEKILSLNPDLILANQEENSRSSVEDLQQAGVPVWISFPRSVQDAIDVLYELVPLSESPQAFTQVEMLERTVEWTRSSNLETEGTPYFCPIWKDVTETGLEWWMTFNDQTYSSDLLALFGGRNIFAERQRRYPLGADLGEEAAQDPQDRDTRYPRVAWEEIVAGDPEIIILPTEPYAFTQDEGRALLQKFRTELPGWDKPIRVVDGSLLTWHGTRLAKALQQFPEVFLNPHS